MSLGTLTPSMAGSLQQTCNGGVAQSVRITPTHDSSVTDSDGTGLRTDHPSGIFGWKKRCLYMLVVMLVVVVVVNMALTIWIIKLLDLSSDGPGEMAITEDGLIVSSEVEFEEVLSAKDIISEKSRPLNVESSRNVSIITKDNNGKVSNKLSLGHSALESNGNYFLVRGSMGNVLFHVDSNEVIVAANNVAVSESGGFRLDGLLQTNLVRGGSARDLRLESPLKSVNIRGDAELKIESRAGGIIGTCLKDMKLQSAKGRVTLDTSRLEIKNLKTSWSYTWEKGLQQVYQVCVCDSGRIFLVHREGYCQIKDSICHTQSHISKQYSNGPTWETSS